MNKNYEGLRSHLRMNWPVKQAEEGHRWEWNTINKRNHRLKRGMGTIVADVSGRSGRKGLDCRILNLVL